MKTSSRKVSLSKAMENGTNGHTEPLKPDKWEWLAVDAVRLSPHNARKHFEEVAMQELAASIRTHGVLEPLLVRPLFEFAGSVEYYELVAGERRYRAALLAGKTEVPAMVRDMTEKQAAEVRIIENEQREDLTPLEKAQGYQDLIDQHGYTVPQIAAKIGKSEAAVYGLLKLLQLPKDVRKALEAGELPSATAQVIARLPNAKQREQAGAEVLRGQEYDGVVMSYRQTLELIETQFTCELKGAPFGHDDANLVPSAGTCTACPKKAGNNRVQYPDGRADMCMDPPCFQEKVKAHGEALRQQAQESGRPVLSGKETKGLFTTYDHTLTSLADRAWVDLAERAYHNGLPGAKYNSTWRELIGKHAADNIVIALDTAGGVHELVKRPTAVELLKKHHKVTPVGGGGDTSWKREQAKRRQQEKVRAEVNRRCVADVVAGAERIAAGVTGFTLNFRHMLVTLLTAQLDQVWADVVRRVRSRRALKDVDLGKWLAGLNGPQLFGFWAEVVATTEIYTHTSAERLRNAVDRL